MTPNILGPWLVWYTTKGIIIDHANLQEICNTGNAQNNQSSGQIHAESPRQRLLRVTMHHTYSFLRPFGAHQSCCLGLRIRCDTSSFGVLSRDDDVAPLQVGSEPALLHDCFERDETASDDGEDDEKDTGACIAAPGAGCPQCRVQRHSVGVGKYHGHA